MPHLDAFQPDCFFHAYNHAVGSENLFRNSENYRFFLRRYTEYLRPVLRTYAHCLMPNHFHLLVQVRDEESLRMHHEALKDRPAPADWDVHDFVMQQFSNFFNSYARSFNRVFNRRGALFVDYLKRELVETEEYFTTLVSYIHQNPVHHGFCRVLTDWPHSSYASLLNGAPASEERAYLMEWFGGQEAFQRFHEINQPVRQDWEFNK